MKIKDRLLKWLDEDRDFLSGIEEMTEQPDKDRDTLKSASVEAQNKIADYGIELPRLFSTENLRKAYNTLGIICCIIIIGTLLLAVSDLPMFGKEYLPYEIVTDKYVTEGLEETGAVNIISGIILDYRAFDTLGESFVLFTALNCVFILLRTDSDEELHEISYYLLSKDNVFRKTIMLSLPVIFVFGIYILLNGHLSPGGGFSGGAVMGAGLILFSSAYGGYSAAKLLTEKRFKTICFVALAFYCLGKTYVFFTGANGINNHISIGTIGNIISSGLILPLNIAVGMVVTCTMYGIYRMFKRGRFD